MNLENDFNTRDAQNSLKCGELDVEIKDLYNKTKQQQSSFQTFQQSTTDSINTLNGSVSTINGNITTLNGNVSTLSGNVSTLSGNVSTLSGNVSTISGTVSSLSGTVTTLGQSVSTIDGQITTINQSINNINSTISSLPTSAEQIDVIYDKNSNDSSVNRGFTAGVRDQDVLSSLDLSSYKYLRIHLNVYGKQSNNFGAPNSIILMSLENPIGSVYVAGGVYGHANDYAIQSGQFEMFIIYNSSAHTLTPRFYYNKASHNSSSTYICKIEGVR